MLLLGTGVPCWEHRFFVYGNQLMGKRIGTIAILVEDRAQVGQINELLTRFGDVIIGRIGIPYREKGVNIISIIVEGTTDEVGALSGKLGMIEGVKTRSLLLTR